LDNEKIRPEISKQNEYWIEKHRYYELKHFCLQYQTWRKVRAALFHVDTTSPLFPILVRKHDFKDPVTECAEAREFYSDRINLIEKTAFETDPIIGKFILLGVTEGMSYDVINANINIPCGKDKYYELYRRFFWLLDKARN
jgi:hypothetical protein